MKKNIAIIMGGYSSEREISLRSGEVVYRNLDGRKFNLFRIDIAREGWCYFDENRRVPVDKNDFSVTLDGGKIKFDAIFNAIHGTPGEDGLLAAYFQLLGIPQTSCDFFEAALTFNKRECLSVLRQYDVPTARSVYLTQGEEIDPEKIVQKVGLPCFVKPNRSGSSFGISKVYHKEDIPAAIEKAFEEDSQILIESFLKGREVSVGVFRWKGKVTVLPITEIVSKNDFFDYQAKYEGLSQEITPAALSLEEKQKVESLAEKVYRVLNLKGLSRSEYILVEGEPHILEVNTTPGLSEASIIPQQAAAMGIGLGELFDSLVEDILK